jgi:hypothetical protein
VVFSAAHTRLTAASDLHHACITVHHSASRLYADRDLVVVAKVSETGF